MTKTNGAYESPSIGRLGEMYHDRRNRRIKFFSPEVHDSLNSIAELVKQGAEKMVQKKATRLNARFLSRNTGYKRNVEARISLNNGFSGVELLFVGINKPRRMDRRDVLDGEDRLLDSVLERERHFREQLQEGYSIERLTSQNILLADIQDMVRMYEEAFPTYTAKLNVGAIGEMIIHSTVYGVRDSDDKIVSTSVAEKGEISLPQRTFRICELSEMATRREHRGRGLISLATQALIEDVRNDVDLIYAEARACHLPINQVFYNLGFNYAGRLMKQCRLSGDHEVSERGPYENLNVWYMLPEHKGQNEHH